MDPENVKEINWALEGEERLFVELEREEAEAQARVALDPASLLGGFDLPQSDLALLQDPEVQEVLVETMAEMFVLNGVSGWVDDDLSFVAPWGFDLGAITVPTEVRFGEHDVLVPASHGRWLVDHVPGAIAAVESGKGHMRGPEEMVEHLRRAAFGD